MPNGLPALIYSALPLHVKIQMLDCPVMISTLRGGTRILHPREGYIYIYISHILEIL